MTITKKKDSPYLRDNSQSISLIKKGDSITIRLSGLSFYKPGSYHQPQLFSSSPCLVTNIPLIQIKFNLFKSINGLNLNYYIIYIQKLGLSVLIK